MYLFEHLYLLLALSWIVTILIAFFVIRGATRANEQVELLRRVLARLEHGENSSEPFPAGKDAEERSPKFEKSDEDYLHEARKRAQLIK
ncbi:hypothetical protein OUL81_000484 [Salmonella enterica]|uniref:Uncharacterized protein n=1 Tax=Salmonella enterica TaxID=28901 RepID=A0A747KD07_SALER|nr:hypothetical protein [Salmonella enterica subsp. enterica serovar Anderlecht]EEJ3528470.1 hypothetical protein [Salmonella enterica subsp. enterica serovar Anderlecht]EKE2788444.1 hypothetical protein [Salmonella enterica]MIX06584.1 hypothetical protein [Salmonella enterica subsp. enterica serovar Anderlecht]HAF4525736.1 hypothetical protein [Salmonella enterica]